MKKSGFLMFWFVFTLLFIISWWVTISLRNNSKNDVIDTKINTTEFYKILPSDIKAEIEDKKVVVINVWATWCQPCRKEMPFLEQLAIKHPNQAFIAVTDQSKEEASSYLNESPIANSFLQIYNGQELINYIANFSSQKKIKEGNAVLNLPTNVIFYNEKCVFIESGFSELNIKKMDSIITSIK